MSNPEHGVPPVEIKGNLPVSPPPPPDPQVAQGLGQIAVGGAVKK